MSIRKAVKEGRLSEVKGRDLDDDDSLILIAAENNQLPTLKYLLWETDLDPVDDDNAAIRTAFEKGHEEIVFELVKHPIVREEIFAECKDELTLDEAKFLLYYHEEIEDAQYLLESFLDEFDDSFKPSRSTYRSSEEYDSDEFSDEYSDDDSDSY